MAQLLALLSLVRRLMGSELRGSSSVALNNFAFCVLFLLTSQGGKRSELFWSSLFFQLVLLAPLLVIFSVDTQHRLPRVRVAVWPISAGRRFGLSCVSFVANPLFVALFFGFLLWMGFAIACSFLLMALVVHGAVYAAGLAMGLISLSSRPRLRLPRLPGRLGGIAQETLYEIAGTLDFWTAMLIAASGSLYRIFARSSAPEAFPMLALLVGIAMSTVTQRMMRLNEGRACLRYRLLPVAGWKLILTQDMTFLGLLLMMVALLNARGGLAFGMTALAVGRYPSLRQTVNQRRGRFVGGDPRFGLAQIVLGAAASIGAARNGLWVVAVAGAVYIGSVIWGELLWRRL